MPCYHIHKQTQVSPCSQTEGNYKVSIIKSKSDHVSQYISPQSLYPHLFQEKYWSSQRYNFKVLFERWSIRINLKNLVTSPYFERRNLNPYMAVTICDQLFLNPRSQINHQTSKTSKHE
ncbi:Hypothetical_protein [Hexamita inflata]|uniref:Hypothetical_protein n=1 Tax=Hexamita inflata TaxID=28002 RepID=A0AA86V5S9_9EUKA|nr:Hypothetical protein HINF_LOCUS65161 [Hexamita inflata]